MTQCSPIVATATDMPSDPSLPGSMRAVIANPAGGSLVMTGFPGLETSFDGTAVFTPGHCRATLEGIRDAGARILVVLVEREELDDLGFDVLEATAASLDLKIIYHPIVDYSAPSDALAQVWRAQRASREAVLRGGGTLAFSCQYGAGRSGLMASWCLIEAGLSAPDAIALVRDHFPEAVESEAQEAWLMAEAALTSAPSVPTPVTGKNT